MAETLSNGVVIPQGTDLIHGSGVQAMRNLGASVDGQLGNRYTKAQADSLLAEKAGTSHTHPVAQVTGLQGALDQAALTAEWAQIPDKPTAFPPSVHQHAQADVTGLAASLATKMNVAATGIVNVDLNSLFTPGVYSQGSSTTAANPGLHYPAPYACRILVMASPTQNQVTQVVWTYFATAQSEMFWRSFIGGTWGPWARVATEADLDGLVPDSDPRLTDARTPLAHIHPMGDVAGLQDALDAAGSADELDALSTRIDNMASAYDVWLENGHSGTEADFLAALRGTRGPEGPYGGTEVTDPQVASWIGDKTTQTGEKIDRAYRAHVSVKEYGAEGDGATDDTAAVQSALTAGAGGTVYFPPGYYRLTEPLAVPRDTTVSGAGSSSVALDWSAMASFRAVSLLAWEKGTVETGSALAADAVRGAASVAVSAGHGLVPGDAVRVLSDEEIVSGEATKAEFQRVLAVDGETVTFGAPLFDSYMVTTGARVQKADLVTGGLNGVSVRGKGVNSGGYGDTVVEFSLARDVTVSDVKFRDVENKCLLMNSVVGLSISDCFFWFDPSFTPLQYGIAATGACQFVSIRGVHSWNDRHMFTTSSSGTLLESRTEYRGVPRFIAITGCTAYGSWQSPIDTHRAGEYISITGNSLTSESAGIKIRGANVLISGNTIVGKTTSGGGGPNGIYIGMLCDGIQIIGNFIRGFRDGVRFDTPDQPSRGLVVSNNHIVDCERPVFVGSTSTMYRLKIDGNYLRALPGPSNYPVYLVSTVEDIEIAGNTLEGGNMGVYVASTDRPVTRALVQGNVVRDQASFGMFFRNMTDALVTGNHVISSDIRFTDVCVNVTTGLNLARIEDLTTGKVITQK